MIDLLPNQTLFIQMGIFIFTAISLHYLVFRPVLRLLAKREELSQGATQEAQKINSATESLIETHHQKILSARNEGIAFKEKFRKEGERLAEEMRQKTQHELEQKIAKTRQEISQQSKECQLILNKSVRDFGREIAEKLLGRKVST